MKDRLTPGDAPHYFTVSTTSFALQLGYNHVYVVSDYMGVGCLTLTAGEETRMSSSMFMFLQCR